MTLNKTGCGATRNKSHRMQMEGRRGERGWGGARTLISQKQTGRGRNVRVAEEIRGEWKV